MLHPKMTLWLLLAATCLLLFSANDNEEDGGVRRGVHASDADRLAAERKNLFLLRKKKQMKI
jgi:hypothetical protein